MMKKILSIVVSIFLAQTALAANLADQNKFLAALDQGRVVGSLSFGSAVFAEARVETLIQQAYEVSGAVTILAEFTYSQSDTLLKVTTPPIPYKDILALSDCTVASGQLELEIGRVLSQSSEIAHAIIELSETQKSKTGMNPVRILIGQNSGFIWVYGFNRNPDKRANEPLCFWH
jgi:hypothetical protein